jgi:hypothetical protein
MILFKLCQHLNNFLYSIFLRQGLIILSRLVLNLLHSSSLPQSHDPPPSVSWDYRCIPPHLAFSSFHNNLFLVQMQLRITPFIYFSCLSFFLSLDEIFRLSFLSMILTFFKRRNKAIIFFFKECKLGTCEFLKVTNVLFS